MTRQGKLGINDLGCYADGANGSDHASRKLADLIHEFDGSEELRKALLQDDDEFQPEVQDEAIEWLNDNVCDYPAQFIFSGGDLLLVNIETWEE
jgi:hypothetical protein